MRSIALALLLVMSLGVATAPESSSAGTQTEQWLRQYMSGLGQEVLAHRTYLRVLLTAAVVGAGILGGFVVWFSWQNRKDIQQIGRYSIQEVDKKIQDYMNEFKQEITQMVRYSSEEADKKIQEYMNEFKKEIMQIEQSSNKEVDMKIQDYMSEFKKEIAQIGRYSSEEVDRKIQDYMGEIKNELTEHRTEVRAQLDLKAQALEKVIQEYINADAIGPMKQVVSFISESILSKYEYYHLDHLKKVEQHSVQYSEALLRDIRRLEALDFINGIDDEPGYEAILRMMKKESSSKTEFDLKQFFQITERGEQYLEQRKT